jgi:DNA-nicking Smr family endonuclease
MRRLTAHEQALWSRVAATVRPIAGKRPAVAAPPPPHPKPVDKPPRTPVPPPPRPLNTTAKPQKTLAGATHDGGWDRKLRTGDIRPDRIIDLHGHTLAAAHDVLSQALDHAHANGDRVLLVITGKGRADRPSRIRGELAHWLDAGAMRSRIASLRTAHPRHGGGGAFYLILRRH